MRLDRKDSKGLSDHKAPQEHRSQVRRVLEEHKAPESARLDPRARSEMPARPAQQVRRRPGRKALKVRSARKVQPARKASQAPRARRSRGPRVRSVRQARGRPVRSDLLVDLRVRLDRRGLRVLQADRQARQALLVPGQQDRPARRSQDRPASWVSRARSAHKAPLERRDLQELKVLPALRSPGRQARLDPRAALLVPLVQQETRARRETRGPLDRKVRSAPRVRLALAAPRVLRALGPLGRPDRRVFSARRAPLADLLVSPGRRVRREDQPVRPELQASVPQDRQAHRSLALRAPPELKARLDRKALRDQRVLRARQALQCNLPIWSTALEGSRARTSLRHGAHLLPPRHRSSARSRSRW